MSAEQLFDRCEAEGCGSDAAGIVAGPDGDARVWRPSDWREIEATLSGGRRRSGHGRNGTWA